jgi:hypothetical protein
MDIASYVATIGAPGHALAMRELRPLSGLGPEDRAEFWPAWQRLSDTRRAEIARALAELAEENVDLDFSTVLTAGLTAAASDEQQPFEVRRRALESAGFFSGDEEVQRQIQRAYESTEQLLKESALVAMGRSMMERWLPAIGRELGSPSPALRYEAARAAGEMAEEARTLVPRLASLSTDEDSEVAGAAIWALGQIGGGAAKRALQQLSKSSDEVRSQAATEALAELNMEDGLLGGGSRPGSR